MLRRKQHFSGVIVCGSNSWSSVGLPECRVARSSSISLHRLQPRCRTTVTRS